MTTRSGHASPLPDLAFEPGAPSPLAAPGPARPGAFSPDGALGAPERFFLSRSQANDALLEHLRDMRWFARSRGHATDGQPEGPRFGALSELSERAPIHLFDHPELERLGPVFTDGRHVFLSANAARAELGPNPPGDPLMTLYVQALALIAGLDPWSAPEIARQADKLAQTQARVALVAPERVALALERSGLGPIQSVLLYPDSRRASGLARLSPLPPGSLPRFSAQILRAQRAFDALASPPQPRR